MEALITALVSGFTTMTTDTLSGIGQVVPVVLPIFAAIVLISVVQRVVKRFSGR